MARRRLRHGPPALWLGAAGAACLVTFALGLAVPQDGAWLQLSRLRRSSNSSSPLEPPKDSSGRPLPPPDGYAHGRGRREVHSGVLLPRVDSVFTAAASAEQDTWPQLSRLRRSSSSNSSSPPKPLKDSSGRPLPPPDGYAHGRGRREVHSAVLLPSVDSDLTAAASAEHRTWPQLSRLRRSSNSSSPPEPPKDSSSRPLPPPNGNAHGRGRRQVYSAILLPSVDGDFTASASAEHEKREEQEHAQRHRRDTSADSSSDDDDDDDDDDADESTSRRGPPPGGAPHGLGPPPRGCGGRRPPTDAGTNSTDTETETLQRFSRRRGRNRG